MKPVENPPRFVEHPEFGRDWSAAAEETINAERLARIGDGVSQSLQSLQSGAMAGGATSVVKTTTLVKLVAPLLVAGGLIGGYLLQGAEVERSDVPAAVVIEEPSEPVEPGVHQATPQEEEPRPKSKRRVVPPVRKAKRDVEKVAPRPSVLPAQLDAFKAAQSDASAGDYGAALQRIGQLQAEHPDTPLRPEIELARADWLVRAGRYPEATTQLQRLLLNSGFEEKKGAIFQMLGDSWVKRGRCDRATGAYEKALSHGVANEQAAMVRTAIKNCEGR